MTAPPLDKLHILAVDDSRAVRTYMEAVLEGHGASVRSVATGRQAVECVGGDERFDLMLLDLNLPDLDGIEVLEQVRAVNQELPVVVVTGAGGLQSATEAVRRGADGYIEKQHMDQADDSAFLSALRQAMEHRTGLVAQRQLQRMKEDLYSMVTHDLRNPAGNVWGIIRLLLAGQAGPLTPQQERLLTVAQQSAAKLTGLINDFLDFATIDAGYLRIERSDTDLREVARRAVEDAEPSAALKRIRLLLSLPADEVRAEADGARLGQVVENLLSNAIKYTPEDGEVRVAVAHEDAAVVFRVRDSGVGIPPEQLPHLFSKFHRVPGDATRGIRGTGLGLVIVHEIVSAHGGQVQAFSEGVPGRGTEFVVTLPAFAPPAG